MEIDALEQLTTEDVKLQGQIMCDGFRTCLMVFRIVTRVVAGVVARVVAGVIAGGDEVYQHHSFTATWPLRACTASSPGPMKNRPLPWSDTEDARGGGHWDGSSSSSWNLTLLAGAANLTLC
jgi:hypothetical protein